MKARTTKHTSRRGPAKTEPRQDELQTIYVEMPTALHEAVMKQCETLGITFSEFARLAIREQIDRDGLLHPLRKRGG